MKYMRQLDSLRALSVMAVLYHHFYGEFSKPISIFIRPIQWGGKGVDLFYVLSGFLITSILLQSREHIDTGKVGVFESFKVFYARRCLRIFPIYYLTLFVVTLLLIPSVRESIYWHATYLSNFNLAITGTSVVPHFWTLSVEEQFYLIWPWLIFLMPRKYILKSMIFIIALSPVYRFVIEHFFNENIWWSIVVPIANTDLLGLGSLLALLRSDERYSDARLKVSRMGLIIGGTLFIGLELMKCFDMVTFLYVFRRTAEGFFFLWIVDEVSEGLKGLPGAVLNFKPLVYIGRISYGIYLYHYFVPTITKKLFPSMYITLPSAPSAKLIVYSIFSLIISMLSWHLIEKPINMLKEKFIY